MSDRARDDEQESDKTSADPYGYLAAGGGTPATPSYLPPGAGPGTGAGGDPAQQASEPPEENDITVGMTRRELRELRARRFERQVTQQAAQPGASVSTAIPAVSEAPETPELPVPDSDDPETPWATPTATESDDETTTLPALSDDTVAPSGFGMPGADGEVPVAAPGRATAEAVPAEPYAALRASWTAAKDAQGAQDAASADATVPQVPVAGSTPVQDAVAPGWHDPQERRPRRRLLWIIGGAVVVIGALVALVLFLGRNGDGRVDPPATPTATATEVTGLAAILPARVEGGEYAEGGKTGVTYSITADGFVPAPNPPAGALESLVGIYAGGAEAVTLTGATFATAEEALAAATAYAGTLGESLESGPVFPSENLGWYWTFNNDGLVTMVWHDGGVGMFTVISEEAADAQGFYGGLEF